MPEVETPITGQGEMHAGRALSNGYRYDHVDLVTEVIGPGGASARVADAPYPGSPQLDLSIRWYYDPFSKVNFSWIYVKGPCDASPYLAVRRLGRHETDRQSPWPFQPVVDPTARVVLDV